MHAPTLARIKILAGLRTDEHFAAQDGRFRFHAPDGTSVDMRVSIAPTYHGENAVMRLLTQGGRGGTLKALGCRRAHRSLIETALSRPHGMILATGPTGSGKTTLLYTLVRMLDSDIRSIITIEDPIEYSLPGIIQVPADPGRGLSFADGLRSILRQDPDVIMVGEIRDAETARLAVNAALTGHLVLSTLHTNDAAGAFPRLLDMGIEPYLIASTLNLVLAQRLVRRICSNCRKVRTPEPALFDRFRKSFPGESVLPRDFSSGTGCEQCRHTGYRGRTGIYEGLSVTDAMREALGAGSSTDIIRALVRKEGMSSIAADGLAKIRRGVTTAEEVLRVAYD